MTRFNKKSITTTALVLATAGTSTVSATSQPANAYPAFSWKLPSDVDSCTFKVKAKEFLQTLKLEDIEIKVYSNEETGESYADYQYLNTKFPSAEFVFGPDYFGKILGGETPLKPNCKMNECKKITGRGVQYMVELQNNLLGETCSSATSHPGDVPAGVTRDSDKVTVTGCLVMKGGELEDYRELDGVYEVQSDLCSESGTCGDEVTEDCDFDPTEFFESLDTNNDCAIDISKCDDNNCEGYQSAMVAADMKQNKTADDIFGFLQTVDAIGKFKVEDI